MIHRIVRILFILLILSASAVFSAEFKNSSDVVKRLSSYGISDIDGDQERLRKKQRLRIDDMFEDLKAANAALKNQTITVDAAYEIQRVSLLTSLHDPTLFAVQLVVPVAKKNKSAFAAARLRFHPVDRELLEDFFVRSQFFCEKKCD